MAELALGISGRLEEGETLQAWVLGSATTLQWQALIGGNWVNVGTANSPTYTVPAGAAGTAYRLVGTGADGTFYSEPTGPAVVDTRKSTAPVLSGPSLSALATEGAGEVSLFHWLTFSDSDKGHYGGGALLLQNSNSVLHGGDGQDVLSIRFTGTQTGQFSYNAATREVRYAFSNGNAVTVATIDSALHGNGTDLKLVFTSNATAAVVNALTDNLQLRNQDDSPVASRLLTLRVTDPGGASAQRVTSVSIENTPDAPLFTSAASATVDENQVDVLTVGAVDPDREAGGPQGISYTLAAGAGDSDNGRFEIDAATGALRFIAAPDFEDPQHGTSYSVRVRATDSEGSTVEQVIGVAVRDVNEAPVASDQVFFTQEDAPAMIFAPQFADPDAGDNVTVTYDATGAIGNIGFDGTRFTYDAAGRFEQLSGDSFGSDAFTYTVTDAAGLSTTRTITVQVQGANDAATITGTSADSVQEDVAVVAGHLMAQGVLTAIDADAGQSGFAAQVGAAGIYGSFDIDSDGRWTYRVDNTLAAVQGLTAGVALTDSFIATSLDGTAGQLVTVTIQGADDAALIGGVTTADVHEDEDLADGFLVASGVLSIEDPDAGQAHFIAQASVPGDVFGGNFSVDESGAWTWRLENDSQLGQVVPGGVYFPDSFTVTAIDGTTQTVTVNVHGANDTASISGVTSLTLTEDVDVVAGELKGFAKAIITDPDFYEAQVPYQFRVPGTGGYGDFTVGESGTWIYRVNAGLEAVQALGEGQALVDTLAVTTVDGSATAVLTATIAGSNDAPTVGAAATGEVREAGHFDNGAADAGIGMAQGVLSGYDIDNGDALSWSGSTAGIHGQFTIDASGHWEYVLDNAATATQALNEGDTVQETFVATVTDAYGATAQQQVVITLHGANDAPVVSYLAGISDFGGSVHAASSAGVLNIDMGGSYVHPIIQGIASGDLLVLGTREDAYGAFVRVLDRRHPDGSLDTSFGEQGYAQLPSSFIASSLTVDGAGRSIAVGYSWGNYGEARTDWAVCRFNADGSPDTSFGNGAEVTLDFDGGYDYGWEAKVDSMGRLLVSGTRSNPVNGESATVVARLGDDGSLDASFGSGGFISLDEGEGMRNVSIDGQGRVLLWGSAVDPSTNEPSLCVARFLADGSLDTGFGAAGRAFVASPGNAGADALAIGDDGGLVIGWRAPVGDGTDVHVQLARLTADGLPDSNFGDNGRVGADLVADDRVVLAIDPQGRVLAAFDDVNGDAGLARFDSSGSLDVSFGGDGAVAVDFGEDDELAALQMLANGDILLSGTTWGAAGGEGAAARFNADGSLDLSFGQPQPAKPTVSGSFYATIDDPDLGGTAIWSGGGVGMYGTLTFNADATWTYVLDLSNPATQGLPAGQTAIDPFTATLTDNFGATVTREIEITIIGTYELSPP